MRPLSTTKTAGSIEIRALTPAEFPAYAALAAYAYNGSPDDMNDWFKALKVATVLGLFEDGQLAVALIDLRLEVWLDGLPVKADGIGGVASAPEVRRRGLVRALIAEHLRQLKDDGVVISLLYPFRFDFYRRMGWGITARMPEFKIPTAQFADYGRRTGRVRPILRSRKGVLQLAPGETVESVIAKLDPIYRSGVSAFNLAVRRDNRRWAQLFELPRGQRHVYAWEDGAGKVQGYVALRTPDTPERSDLIVREMFAVTPEAWRGLFYFLSCHDSQSGRVAAALPPEHPMLDLLADPRAFELGKWTTGPMTRVVDVAGLLKEKAQALVERSGSAGAAVRSTGRGAEPGAGAAAGSCVIKVEDGLAPWNDGCWVVSLSGTNTKVGKTPGAMAHGQAGTVNDAEVDLRMDISAFSTLAAGARRVEDLLAFGLAGGRRGPGLEFAESLFGPRPVWHTEYY